MKILSRFKYNMRKLQSFSRFFPPIALAFMLSFASKGDSAARPADQLPALAASQTADGGAEQTGDEEDLTMAEALAIPEVPPKQNAWIRDYMKREALALHKLGYRVETMRKGEIVIATIPTDKLFGPNSTRLLPTAPALLKNFLAYFKVEDRFKVVLAVHTDDTGSDAYLTDLAGKRIEALYDYFDASAPHTDTLIGYPIAASEPLKENNTRAGRAENRRLEIYILPSNGLIQEAARAPKSK